MLPDRSILQQMAKASYEVSPPQMIDGWTLLYATPTLKFYKNESTIVVAIRGTNPTDRRDLEADAKIPLNRLESTPRYQTDMSTLLNVMKSYPTSTYEYYGVGHSLGGAILDSFIKDGWIRNGISYNPAVQPRDFKRPTTNQRIYQSGDPLYSVFGRFTQNAEVRPPKTQPIWEALLRKVPYVGTMFGLFKDHQLGNFEGGSTHRENVLKKYSLKEDGYSIAELAKITGIPRKTLQEVYNRGIGAYKTNPQSVRMKGSFKKGVNAPMSKKLSKEQWGMARVYSFIDGNPKHDQDLVGSGGKMERFHQELREIGMTPTAYLREARKKAKESGYSPSSLHFADDGVHKLAITEEGRTTAFGAVGYKDHLMWSALEKKGDVEKGTAEAKRRRFQVSHRAMKGDWKSNPYSANRLALAVLW